MLHPVMGNPFLALALERLDLKTRPCILQRASRLLPDISAGPAVFFPECGWRARQSSSPVEHRPVVQYAAVG